MPNPNSTALGEIVRLHASVTRRRGGMTLLKVTPQIVPLPSLKSPQKHWTTGQH